MKFTLHTAFPYALTVAWNALLAESSAHVPFLRADYLAHWAETCGGGEWPGLELAIVTAEQEDRLIGIAPLFFAPGGAQRLMLLGSVQISDYLDVIARPEDLPAFLSGLLDFLAGLEQPWRTLDLFNLLDSSPSLPLLRQAAEQRGWDFVQTPLQRAPFIPLPGNWQTYLASLDKKQRHEIRRKMRRLDESGIPWRWYVVQQAETLAAEMDEFLRLMAYDPAKAEFLTPLMRQQMQRTMQCAFDAGCLHLSFLEIGGQKAAAYLSFDYLNRLWVYNSGLDRQFVEFSPGWVLLAYLLQWANENGRTEFDFMRGDEEYKYRFGALDRMVVRAELKRHLRT